MSQYISENIRPFKGTESFVFGSKLEEVKEQLKNNHIKYTQSINPNKGCVPEIPWVFISIENSITLCFVEGVLFEIILENNYTGTLHNGGCIGMQLAELEKLDATLDYNDDEEDYSSDDGYWVEDDLESGKITAITIFVPEVLEDDFFSYQWVEKYR